MKKYIFEGEELYKGKVFTDSNGYSWEIIWLGPRMVKAVCLELPNLTPTYTAHWHFVLSAMRRGILTNHINSINI